MASRLQNITYYELSINIYEYTTVTHSYTVPYSYTESDTTHTRWETENNGSTTSNYSDETSSQTSWSQENSSTSRLDSLNQLAISDLLDILKASESQEVRELAVEIENIEPKQAIEDIVAALNDSTLNLTEIEEDTLEVLKRKISSFIVVGPGVVGPADYTYEVYDGKVTITGANLGTSSSITIPSTLGGYPVTEIGDSAFSNCTNLTSITIPDSVTSIGDGAFSGCTSLSSITIPDSVTSIGDYAFNNCTKLASITVDSNNKNYSSDEYGVLFNKDKTELIQYPAGNSRTSYSIPDSVMSIVYDAFYGCTSLEDIYYSGTDEEWNEIISDGIPNIKIHFGNEAPTEPTTKPTKPAVRLEINSPSTKSINYGDSIVLHADIEWTHPDGAKTIKVVWSADNGNFSYSVSPDGLSCTISPESSGETVFTATVYDMDGNEISSDTVQMTAKASIWHKIIAFFKKLLSLNEIIPYAMKNLYKK